MSNTDLLRASEADLLPPGFVQDHVFDFTVDGYRGRAEVEPPERGSPIGQEAWPAYVSLPLTYHPLPDIA